MNIFVQDQGIQKNGVKSALNFHSMAAVEVMPPDTLNICGGIRVRWSNKQNSDSEPHRWFIFFEQAKKMDKRFKYRDLQACDYMPLRHCRI